MKFVLPSKVRECIHRLDRTNHFRLYKIVSGRDPREPGL